MCFRTRAAAVISLSDDLKIGQIALRFAAGVGVRPDLERLLRRSSPTAQSGAGEEPDGLRDPAPAPT